MQLKYGRQWSTPEYGLNQEGTIRVTLRIKGRKKYFSTYIMNQVKTIQLY